MLAQETVSWVAVTVTPDTYGNTTATEAAPVELTALVARPDALRAVVESVTATDAHVVTRWELYLLDTDVVPGADDWFTVRGDRHDVDGPAFRWGTRGVELTVKRASA
jgi:hypothetical protein